MKPLLALTATLLLTDQPCYSGPCSLQIAQMRAEIDARLDGAAQIGPTAAESSAATLHRQPTPKSIAAVEAEIGDLSPYAVQIVGEDMARAHAADVSGDKSLCDQALGDARSAIARDHRGRLP
jgi:hypothetical protein